MLIKKGGCCTNVTKAKYLKQYKHAGYVIVQDDPIDKPLEEMEYKDLQDMFSQKFSESPVGVKKVDLIERLKEVL